MIARGHTHECSKFISLRSGRKHKDLIIGVVTYPLYADKCILFDLKHAELLNHFNIRFHASSLNNDLFLISLCYFNELYKSFQLGGKGPYDHSSFHTLYELLNVFVHFFFRKGESRSFNIGGIGHQKENVSLFKFFKLLFLCFCWNSINMVKFKVSGMYNAPVWCFDNYPH